MKRSVLEMVVEDLDKCVKGLGTWDFFVLPQCSI
jgi:hypothetical protein